LDFILNFHTVLDSTLPNWDLYHSYALYR